jgi:hypothetical protein
MVPGSEAARGPRKKSLRAKSASSVAIAADSGHAASGI